MSPRARMVGVVALGIVASIALTRLSRHVVGGRTVPGGVLMADAGRYDLLSRIVFGRCSDGSPPTSQRSAPAQARVLEVGSGPGLLATELAAVHDLEVTGLDLDPAMVERARANAARSSSDGARQPTFVVGDVAALPFEDWVLRPGRQHVLDAPLVRQGEAASRRSPGYSLPAGGRSIWI